LEYVYTGNAPGNELSDTKCPSCKSSLITRMGYRITVNNLKDGKCNNCSSVIDGIWS